MYANLILYTIPYISKSYRTVKIIQREVNVTNVCPDTWEIHKTANRVSSRLALRNATVTKKELYCRARTTGVLAKYGEIDNFIINFIPVYL